MSASSLTAHAGARPAMSTRLVVLILSLLLGLQPVTTDLYLPALPGLVADLGAGMPQAQLTLTALLLAFGLSQLVWGPLSDRFGRRPVLLAGMALYVAAAVGAALAPDIAWLIVWRTVQGVAMGAGVMAARALVRDLYSPAEGARAMSRGLTGLGFIACASAPLGGLLSDWAGWRVALAALAVFGAITLAVIAWRFLETIPARNPHALAPRTLLAVWWQVLRHPTFRAWSALSTASYGGLFTFLAASSFVFIGVYGMSKPQYGLVMFSMSVVYIAGTFGCRWLLARHGVRRVVAIAAGFTLAGGTLMGLLALAGVKSPWAILMPFWLYMLAHGVHQPCGQSGAVGPFPHAAGAASALNGFLMMVAAFLVGGWLGVTLGASAAPLAWGLWFWSTVIAVTAWTLVQRHGEPPATPVLDDTGA